jgi:hypothetical protein
LLGSRSSRKRSVGWVGRIVYSRRPRRLSFVVVVLCYDIHDHTQTSPAADVATRSESHIKGMGYRMTACDATDRVPRMNPGILRVGCVCE